MKKVTAITALLITLASASFAQLEKLKATPVYDNIYLEIRRKKEIFPALPTTAQYSLMDVYKYTPCGFQSYNKMESGPLQKTGYPPIPGDIKISAPKPFFPFPFYQRNMKKQLLTN